MEFSTKDKLLSLIFPVLTVLYGLWVIFLGREYLLVLTIIVGGSAIAAGVLTGALTLAFKIDTTEYLNARAIVTGVTLLIHLLIVERISWIAVYNICNMAVGILSVFISTVKMPYEASVRDRLIVLFSNPVLFALLSTLAGIFSDFLWKSGAV